MKKPLVLLIVLAALVGVAVLTKKQKEAKLSNVARSGVSTREYLLPNLDVNAVKTVKIKDKDEEVTLKQGAEQWSVQERSGYPVSFDKLSRALMDLRDTKIAGKQLIGQGAWADENLLEPAEGVASGSGTLVKLLDDKDGEIASLIIGDTVEVSGSNVTPFGRDEQILVRIPQDEDSVWKVGSDLRSLSSAPEDWVDKAFISVQDIATLSVTAPEAAESWKVSRKTKDDTDFTFEGLKPEEEYDPAKLSLTGLLSSASFNDVKARADAGDLFKDASKAQITTFDGFTYDIQVAKQQKDGADKYFMTVAVSAKLPEKREPGKDESEEDKKRLDDEFKAAQDRLKEKLEKEKKFDGWVFEVAEYTVNNLLKKRSDLVKPLEPAPAPAAETPAAPGAAVPPAEPPATATTPPVELKEPVSVSTPPIAVPQAPATEVKPAPAPDANPAKP